MILAGDIGGTKTTLALFEDDRRGAPSVWETYRSSEHATFMDVVRTFVRSHPADIELACVGVAGPVKDNRSQTTNLPWVVDGAELAREVRIPQAWLLNDLEAFAYGIEVIRPEDIHELQAGAPDASGNRAVIAAGTGLGEAGLFWNGTRHIPFGTEGGHGDFAPHDELEIDLLRYLLRELEHVSW